MKKTPWIIAAASACVLGAGGGGTAWAMSNVATIDAYGQETQQVRSFGGTVAELLEAEGITVSDTDLVIPGLDEQVTDGMDIQVVQRHPVTVTVDGEEQELLVTGDTVGDALDEVDYEAEGARVTPEPETALTAAEATDVEVVTRKTVTFKGQYGEDTFDVTALTVDEAMTKVLDDIEDTDKADVDRDSILEDGQTITVKRVREEERTETVETDFETKTEDDDSLEEGTTETKTEGEKGETEKVYAEKVVDGEVTESEVVSEEVISEPVTEVVLRGTKPAPEPEPEATESRDSGDESSRSSERDSGGSDSDSSDSGSSDGGGNSGESAPAAPSGSNWDRLAECESGGDWSINTGNGYYGGLQFNSGTWAAYGGHKYAPNAHQATRDQQIDIAKKVQANQGWGAWPACTSKLGLR